MFYRNDHRAVGQQVLAPYLVGYADRRAKNAEGACGPESVERQEEARWAEQQRQSCYTNQHCPAVKQNRKCEGAAGLHAITE